MAKRTKKPSKAVKNAAGAGTILSVLTGMGAVYAAKKLGISLEESTILVGGLLTGVGTLGGAAVAYASRGGRSGESD